MWDNTCRTCMDVEGTLLPLFNEGTEDENDYPSKIAELASIEVCQLDGLPTKICGKCAYRVDAFVNFKSLIQESDKKLKQLINENESNQINNRIEIQYVEATVELNKSSKDQNKNASSTSMVSNKDSVLQDVENSIKKTVLKDIDNSCDTVILRLDDNDFTDSSNDDDEINNIQVVIHSDDLHLLKEINNGTLSDKQGVCLEVIDVKESHSSILNNTFVNVDQTKSQDTDQNTNQNYENKFNVIESNGTHKQNQRESFKRNESENQDDCDSILNNIVGSLNDTVTKIREVEKDDKTIEYQCSLCLKNYSLLYNVLCHIINVHVPSSGPFFCVICEKDCNSLNDLKKHATIHLGTNPYSCFLCQKAYVRKRYLKRHMACHTDFPRFRCTKCGNRFKIKSELESHIDVVHKNYAAFKCTQCNKSFNHKGNYKRHLVQHLDPGGEYLAKYPCQTCSKRFVNNRSLRIHMRVHTGEKPYICDICNKSFSQQGNLINHLRIHENNRSYLCDICGKSFNQKATLKDHSFLHTGKKPYACNICKESFTFPAALRRHSWVHSKGKPHKCLDCDAEFIGSYELNRHMKVHKKANPKKLKMYTAE